MVMLTLLAFFLSVVMMGTSDQYDLLQPETQDWIAFGICYSGVFLHNWFEKKADTLCMDDR